MKIKHFFYMSLIASGVALFYFKLHYQKLHTPFVVTRLEKRTIKHHVCSVGVLELKDTIKVGSLVSGTVRSINAQEHKKVTKGDLLATIDNGKLDTEVKEATAQIARNKALVEYQQKQFVRAENLIQSDNISEQEFERFEQFLLVAQAELELSQATLEKKTLEFNNLNIIAPIDGTVVAVGITEGMRITTDLDATVLFHIARDLSIMHGILEIDESDIGNIKTEQKVSLNIESYPYKTFSGNIINVRYSPKTKGGILFYHATVEISNSEGLLRPGMTLQARIHVAKEKNRPTLPISAFSLTKEKLLPHAQCCQKTVISLSAEEKKHVQKKRKNQHVQFVWILTEDSCKEVPVVLGITDDLYFHILDGISEQDAIICNINSKEKKKNKTLFS
ncbi:efflux RND transporter periplasmic adaptor subunit [Candidatus Babeliales bacterium]|nr:efflux RND transporter periplasmic adaptor subunit [Candidatus Babeliales bacterium]